MKGRLLVAVKSIDLSKEIFGQKKKKEKLSELGEARTEKWSEKWNLELGREEIGMARIEGRSTAIIPCLLTAKVDIYLVRGRTEEKVEQ